MTATNEIISRADAKARGLKFYFTGKPCLHGHVAERYLFGGCTSCMREHKSKDDYKSKNRAYAKRYREENPERVKANQVRYYKENREYHLQRRIDYRRANIEIEKAKARADKKNKRPYYTALTVKRRAAQKNALPSWYSELDDFAMQEAADLARLRAAATGFAWDVDHMIPLQAREACGLHCAANLQVIPASMNRAKNNKIMLAEPGEWLR